MKWQRMKYLFLAILVLVYWSCKEQKPVQQTQTTAESVVEPIPKIIQDMALFADLDFTDPSEIPELMVFKSIDSEGVVQEISMKEVSKICKQAMTRKQMDSYPIIECVQNSKSILMVQGKGFVGPIWGKLMLDTESMELEKVAFDHSSESEGYGASMTWSSFENQFTGTDISQEPFSYGLSQNNSTVISGTHMVDGISGATESSIPVIEMMNEGLNAYKTYLTEIANEKLEVQ